MYPIYKNVVFESLFNEGKILKSELSKAAKSGESLSVGGLSLYRAVAAIKIEAIEGMAELAQNSQNIILKFKI